MPPNSIVKDSLVVGGLTLLGYMAGGKLGSMFGAVIGTVVCSLFNLEEPTRPPGPTVPTRSRPRIINRCEQNNSEPRELPKCSICLEPFKPSIVLLPCAHMCFCGDCFETVWKKKLTNCPICREHIEEYLNVYT